MRSFYEQLGGASEILSPTKAVSDDVVTTFGRHNPTSTPLSIVVFLNSNVDFGLMNSLTSSYDKSGSFHH